jgi:hypothetical protein
VLGYLWIVKSDIKDQDVIEKIYAKALVIWGIIGFALGALYSLNLFG